MTETTTRNTRKKNGNVATFPRAGAPRVPSAKRLVANALQGARMIDRGKRTFTAFPQLQKITERFAWFLSDEIRPPASKKSLLELSLREALTWMAARQSADGKSITRDAVIAFVAGLINRTPYLLEMRVVGRGGVEWSPFTKESLCDFRERHGPIEVESRETNGVEIRPLTIKTYVATHLLTSTDLIVIGGNLQSIIDYRND